MATTLDRTPSSHRRNAIDGVWCFERQFDGQEKRPPVRLVLFDWDETLTLSTFLPADQDLRNRIGWCQWAEFITLHNFETPFVKTPGETRVDKLKAFLSKLRDVDGGPNRTLAILTRNNQGVIACLNLLMMAGLDDNFEAIWCMANVPSVPQGVYRHRDGKWLTFSPPLATVYDHKADVLHAICRDPSAWLPQLAAGAGARPPLLEGLRPEEVVLVDDVRTNFQSHGPDKLKVPRYCKVARYDCYYRDMGFKADMGGIGARSDLDYETLADFVRQPWQYKGAHKILCTDISPACASDDKPRVDLVVLDFDETLTLYTWMPPEEQFAREIGFAAEEEWREHYVSYNFHSPYVDGDRVAKLSRMLEELAAGDEPEEDGRRVPRTLAVLARNESGAVAILNLLLLAGLAQHFAAIWTLGTEKGFPDGVYRDGARWRVFDLPEAAEVPSADGEPRARPSKADVLRRVVADPQAWFPQLAGGARADLEHLRGMPCLASVVLVDDQKAELRSSGTAERSSSSLAVECDGGIVRHCEVTRYDDDNYRDQGLIVHMGGIGAKTDEDYAELLAFVRRPWMYQVAPAGEAAEEPSFFVGAGARGRAATEGTEASEEVPLERSHTQEELDAECVPERKRTRALTLPAARRGGYSPSPFPRAALSTKLAD